MLPSRPAASGRGQQQAREDQELRQAGAPPTACSAKGLHPQNARGADMGARGRVGRPCSTHSHL